MGEDRFITLAIHTYERALALRTFLEAHAIAVRLENVDLGTSSVNSGVRVRIRKSDLPLALKLVESGDGESISRTVMKMTGVSGNLLIPVDFSQYSMLACRLAFQLARRLDLHPVLLHAFATPYFAGALPYSEDIPGDFSDNISSMEASADMRVEAEKMMRKFRVRVEDSIVKGDLPDVKFTSCVREGVPEDVILDYCRATPPALVVMATRGREKKEEELIGSVTAEVLDSCRVPVFTVPENCVFDSVESIVRLAYFCNLDQQDIISIDSLMRMFGYPDIRLTLIPVNPRAGSDIRKKVAALCDYLVSNYPTAKFNTAVFSEKNFRSEFERFEKDSALQMIIVPNKKKNVFSRLFNPGIAHKILFEKDMPLLALPV